MNRFAVRSQQLAVNDGGDPTRFMKVYADFPMVFALHILKIHRASMPFVASVFHVKLEVNNYPTSFRKRQSCSKLLSVLAARPPSQ